MEPRQRCRGTALAALLLLEGLGVAFGWTDIAAALTHRGTSHVWQGCPANGGWHGSASADGVHWQDRGITVVAVNVSPPPRAAPFLPCPLEKPQKRP